MPRSPDEENYKLTNLIKDPIHCIVGAHTHLSASEVCYSAICSLFQKSPGDTYERIWEHVDKATASAEQIENGEATEEQIEKGPQMCYFVGMSAVLILVKPLMAKGENYEYLTKRWKALLAGLNMNNGLETGLAGKTCQDILMKFSEEVAANKRLRDIYVRFILRLLIEEKYPTDTTTRAVIDQIKMVWDLYGMYTITSMERIVNENVMPLGCATIAEEAIHLKRVNQVKAEDGETLPIHKHLRTGPSGTIQCPFPQSIYSFEGGLQEYRDYEELYLVSVDKLLSSSVSINANVERHEKGFLDK